MGTVFKEDLDDAKQRMDAWWEHENDEQPGFAYTYIRPDRPVSIIGVDNWFLAKHPDAIDDALDKVEKYMETVYFGGDSIPNYHPNYGPGILASVLGCEPEFKSGTTWFRHPVPLQELVSFLESQVVDAGNPWFDRLKRVTARAAERGRGRYQVAVTDLGGILDVVASFLSPAELFRGMKRHPEIIDAAREIVLEAWLKVYDELQTTIESHGHGCNAWLDVWCRKRWYPLQCDVSYGISPEMFRRFVLPDLVTQAEHMDYAIYHLDGVGQLPFLDDLLAEPSITGIQWVPGAGKPPMGDDEWMPVYRKIQAAGKNLVQTVSPELALKMIEKLDPRGLMVRTSYGAAIMAEFYLPKFLGGMGGEDIDDDDGDGF